MPGQINLCNDYGAHVLVGESGHSFHVSLPACELS